MSRVLVTGGAGFIGSNIVDRLVHDNFKVIVIDNFSSGKIENLAGSMSRIELVKGDIRDNDLIKKIMPGVDFVLHQAALRSVPKSVAHPLEYNEVNVTATLHLLKCAADAKVKRFVLASSSSIYGESTKEKQNELDLPLLISPYAANKLAGEYYCRVFSKVYSLETVSLRYFNVFGPRQSLESEYAVVVPKFIICLLNNQSPPIYGTGKQSRDFTYIDNVVDANLIAMTRKNVSGLVFNIGCGQTHSVIKLYQEIKNILGSKIKPVFNAPRPGDVIRTKADISRAKKLLGYTPKIAFDQGLIRTVKWFSEKR
jgi:nucleoside-diphosphate-sugar epimerase